MSEKKQEKPPEKLWLLSQVNGWITWTGTEQDLNDWIKNTGIHAYEYVLTGKEIKSHE